MLHDVGPDGHDSLEALQARQAMLEQQLAHCRAEMAAVYPDAFPPRPDLPQSQVQNVLDHGLAAIVSLRLYPDRPIEYEVISPKCEEILGYTIADFMTIPNLWQSQVYPEDWETVVWPLFSTLPTTGTITRSFDYRFWRKDGCLRWLSANFVAQWQDVESFWRITVVDTDVTDRKQAEADFRQSELRCQTILAAFPDLLTLWDRQGCYQGLIPSNTNLVDLVDRRVWLEEPVGRHITELLPPEIASHHLRLIQQVAERGTMDISEQTVRVEDRVQHEELRVVPINSQSVLLIVRDISTQKQANDALQHQTQQEIAFNHVVQAIRQSLDLATIFSTAVTKIASLLDSAAAIVQYCPDRGCWVHVAIHSQNPEQMPNVGSEIPDQDNPFAAQLKQRQVVNISHTSHITDPINQELARANPGAWLLTPILLGDTVWGSLSLARLEFGQVWHDSDIALAQRVADQLAIAIHQAQLYDQAQAEIAQRQQAQAALAHLNQTLKQRVRERSQDLAYSQLALQESQHIAHLGSWMLDVETNTMTWSRETFYIYGLDPEQPVPTYEVLMQNHFSPETQAVIQQTIQGAIDHGNAYEIDLPMIRADGARRWLMARGRQTQDDPTGKMYVIGTIMDITDRKQAEEKILASLREKDVLIQEIHHRVKNNLQVICSLLNLQANAYDDPHIVEPLAKSQQRVRAMALVHERMYQSNNLARLNIATYLKRLVGDIVQSYEGYQSGIQINVDDVAPMQCDADTAIACGLIVNELLSNAFKYAFPDHRPGTVWVAMAMLSDHQPPSIQLQVRDNGIGMPADFDWQTTRSLGYQIVTALVNQIRGTLALEGQQGTQVTIVFPRQA